MRKMTLFLKIVDRINIDRDEKILKMIKLAEKMVEKMKGSEEEFERIQNMLDKLRDRKMERNVAETVMEGVAINPGWCLRLGKHNVSRIGKLWKTGETLGKAICTMTRYDAAWISKRPGKDSKRRC